MRSRTCTALLLLLSACATTDPSPGEWMAPNPRLANLQRAAQYPWTDDGHCVVREASNEWPVLAERCYHALDLDRVRFRDVTGRCAVAQAGAAVAGVGLCVFAAPEIVVGAVVVLGLVVVAVAIKEELDTYERSGPRERGRPKTQTRPSTQQDPSTDREPQAKGAPLSRDWFPPNPPVSLDPRDRRPECKPKPVPHRGGNDDANRCADRIPGNGHPGWDVLVNGKNFDALQPAARMLWEVKAYNFDKYPPDLRRIVIKQQVVELRNERFLAEECGYGFTVGVRSTAHMQALLDADRELTVVVMDWC